MRNISEILGSVPSAEELKSHEEQFLPENDWIILKPRETIEILGVAEKAPREVFVPSPTSSTKGKYTKNNSRIAFFDLNGNYRLASATEERIKGLERCGYTEGGDLTVLLSNNERPTNPEIAEKFDDFMEEAHKENPEKLAA
ncbi:MAG: hypothetical protein UU40_C0010G0014 [Candidatus Uhrbacteria bacterium GW2011_GWD2_41_121]|uniref:Uncharacterized protein n=1 Tax=Candidatus Uhrbacteria bacterium GW2011_GWC1_41_20 TaxID=1618983 RepID=A0A0G0XR03_9BACT|nr:MAG: hypothetical protein UT52_C0008G0013 [Candidatus Uhrbacteria bacterium GW2011_GWE1_39_46]KKR64066.1 MAG: hypothetical protein UU04_C0006G0013 [Candidatus Uhrbacteria bacterium GW2011_GWC2_40_450]KKR89456.1 MAG: hypothetical protein UU36_C0027G0006 [Candidatus Uhrbacteria bacterium GW2011_GWE2_41_1153]KKR89991.1 MAG: hypothetical protein UU40_C0010G0014 [Candidatus Uhrbacteria bacterium GW2011_GWD2_41_121]KKR95900.1 MAG: hypothetical protein UU46_C0011G0007 [Candidatus Uhrbacteria bacter